MSDKKAETKERIFEAALNLFSKNGFHGTTTRKISIEADVNEVTLFRHFKTKACLFKEVINHVKRTNANLNNIIKDDAEPEDAVKAVVKNVLSLILKYPREYKMIMYGLLDQVEGFEEEIFFEYQVGLVDYLTPAITALQEEQRVHSPLPPENIAKLLISQTLGVANSLVLPAKSLYKGMKQKQLVDAIVSLYIQ